MKPKSTRHYVLGLAAAVGLLASGSASALDVGVLTCTAVPNTRVNLLIRSTTDIRCTFKDSTGKTEHYKGETGIALGLDLSFKNNERFAFTVISQSAVKAGSHPLVGKYYGGKASASLGVGLGAAALVGGSNNSVGLNPLALESNEGLGASGGLGFLYLEAGK